MLRATKYFSYWDVPRTFIFERDKRLYVLTSKFDEALDEYPDEYEVFVALVSSFSCSSRPHIRNQDSMRVSKELLGNFHTFPVF